MRRRTFLLIILILLAVVFIGGLFVVTRGEGSLANLIPGRSSTQPSDTSSGTGETGTEDPGLPPPPPTATPEPQFASVVVSEVRLPAGELITADLLTTEQRPVTNIAIRGAYTFTNTETLVGRITRIEISKGQEILDPMLLTSLESGGAADITDIASFGSDLALHIPSGQVAIAFPIDPLSGLAYAMRPGDTIDVLMTLRTIEIDPEFRSALPNINQPIIESALLAGQQFIFGEFQEGRLEFISQLNQVAIITPGDTFASERFFLDSEGNPRPIPKRVTQLSIQRAKVLWVGAWEDPSLEQPDDAEAGATPTPQPSRSAIEPSVVILSMTSQQALSLKWAREQGVDIDLALRSPGDITDHFTVSVSLPQIIDQGSIAIPDPINFDIYDGE